MLSGPTLYRLSVSVPGENSDSTAGSLVEVDTHVRLAGGQSYVPYVTQPFIEQFGTFLDTLGVEVYQEFAESLLRVSILLHDIFISSPRIFFRFSHYFSEILRELSLPCCPAVS